MLCRPWSACSLVFLTMKRSVWDNHNSTTAHFCCSSSFTIVLASGPTGTKLQSSARCFPHRVLHRVYDLCGAEPLHLRHSGGIHSGADTSQGNSPTPGLKCCWCYCSVPVEAWLLTCLFVFFNDLRWNNNPWVILNAHCSCSRQKRMRLWTWCLWKSAVCLESNVRKKETAWPGGQTRRLRQITHSQLFLLGTFMMDDKWDRDRRLTLWDPSNALL